MRIVFFLVGIYLVQNAFRLSDYQSIAIGILLMGLLFSPVQPLLEDS